MKWKKTAVAFCLAPAAIGLVGLAGWMFDIEALIRIHPAWVTMKANTAICLILAGTGTALLRSETMTRAQHALVRVFSLVIGAIGLVTLGEHMGWDVNIDHVFFTESQAHAGRSFPGRMGPASALNFVLIGTAMMSLGARSRRGDWLAQPGALLVMVITLLVFLAYFYSVEMPKGLENYFSIAVHTVIAFQMLAIGLLLARPDAGVMRVVLGDDGGGIIARRLLPLTMAVPGLIGWLCILGRDSGFFGRGAGTALLAAALTIIFSAVVWWAVRALSQLDARRTSAEVARNRLAEIVDSSADAIVGKTLEGIVTSWNAGAEKLFGLSPEHMIGQPIQRIIPPHRQAEEDDILARLRQGKMIDHYETQRLTRSGGIVDVSLSISPVCDEKGAVIGASEIVRDITLRKQTEAALAQQQEWFRVTLSSIGDAVIATDAAGRVSFLNTMAESMTGWRSAEAAGRPMPEVIHLVKEESGGAADHVIERVLRDGVVTGLGSHTAVLPRAGHEISIEDTAAPIRDAEGSILGAVIVFHDVTERRRDAKALADARDAAEAANRAKDDFLAVLSHELRTPLTPSLMVVAELESDPPADPQVLRESLALVRRNIELEARLVDDLLDVTRISHGKLRLASTPVDVHTAIRDALAIADPMFREKDIRVTVHLGATRHLALGDAARLTQIFSNLLTNAAKFTAKTGRVSVRTEDVGEGEMRTEVSDDGIGISAGLLPHVFEPFRQGPAGTVRRAGGLGLGLSVAKNLAEAHKGRITVTSAGENLGATFAVVLPVQGSASNTPQTSTQPSPVSALKNALRILIVEDHEDTRKSLVRLIKSWGHGVRAAGSVSEARALIQTEAHDLLLSDIGLPDGTGLDVVAEWKSHTTAPRSR